jgi:hypothetical protein
MAKGPVISGVITVVQERRFQLEDDSGVRHLFLLAPDAAAEEHELAQCAARRSPVRVHYREAPGLVAHVAQCVEAQAGGGTS